MTPTHIILYPANPCSYASVESDLVFLGLVGLQDPPRPEVAPAIRRCKQVGRVKCGWVWN